MPAALQHPVKIHAKSTFGAHGAVRGIQHLGQLTKQRAVEVLLVNNLGSDPAVVGALHRLAQVAIMAPRQREVTNIDDDVASDRYRELVVGDATTASLARTHQSCHAPTAAEPCVRSSTRTAA